MSSTRKSMPAPLSVKKLTLGGTLAGAGAGAKLGASIGSFWPGAGNVIGGVIGTVAGGLVGALTSGKERRRAKREAAAAEQTRIAEQRTAEAQREVDLQSDKAALSVFPSEGVEQPSMFDFVAAEGGEIPEGKAGPLRFQALKGGRLKKLGDGIFLASGRSHGQGGIQGDSDGDGEVDVEIEDGELFFDEGNGFVVSKDVSKRFLPQFRRLKGDDRLSRETRSRLVDQAKAENEAVRSVGRTAA